MVPTAPLLTIRAHGTRTSKATAPLQGTSKPGKGEGLPRSHLQKASPARITTTGRPSAHFTHFCSRLAENKNIRGRSSHHCGLGGVSVSLPGPSWRRKRQAHHITRQGLCLVLAPDSQQPWNSARWLRGPKGTVLGLVVEGSYLGRGTGGGSRCAGPA